MRVAAAVTLALAALASVSTNAVGAGSSTPSPPASLLRISASLAVRGGSKAYFRPETNAPSTAASPGFLWAKTTKTSSGTSIIYKPGNGFDVDFDDDDDDDDDHDDDDDRDDDRDDSDDDSDDKIAVTPYKRHYTIKLTNKRRASSGSGATVRNGIELSVRTSVRTFVRAMASSDSAGEDKLVAKVVVRGDAKSLVDAALDVVETRPSRNASAAAFCVRDASSSLALSGRLLVQVWLNTRYFHVASLAASGDSTVVVVDDGRLLRGATTPRVAASGRAALFVSLETKPLQMNALTLAASNASSLVVQSMESVSLAHVELRQQQHATLAFVAKSIAAASVNATSSGGRVCVHTLAASAASTVAVDVSGDDALVEWVSAKGGGVTSERLVVSVTGRHARADTRGIQSQVVNATVMGVDAVAVVSTQQQLLFRTSSDARGVVYTGTRPSVIIGIGAANKLHAASADASDAAMVATSPCALTTLLRDFPLPSEHAAFLTMAPPAPPHIEPHPMVPPFVQPVAAVSTDRPLIFTHTESPSSTNTNTTGSTADDQLGVFINSSLHRLGSVPYVTVLVVFLASAWILHHLLQCYDRRQRRRPYQPLGEQRQPFHANDDRVWI